MLNVQGCSGERLVEELAPELVPMLTALEMPANFVPVTNAVLSEMARRGVSRDKILATLRAMGSELPLGTLRLLQWAQRTGIDVRVLSDCNTLFIGHILTGALLTILSLLCSVRQLQGRACPDTLQMLKAASALSLSDQWSMISS